MAHTTGTKQIAILLKRSTRPDAKLVIATGFKLRPDKTRGMVDIHLEQRGQKGERVTFDPTIIKTNLEPLKQYAAGLTGDADDAAMKEDIAALSDSDVYANAIYSCQSGGRAETIFARFRWSDWVEASQQGTTSDREVECLDVLVVIADAAFQKKFLLELLVILNEDKLL